MGKAVKTRRKFRDILMVNKVVEFWNPLLEVAQVRTRTIVAFRQQSRKHVQITVI
jgi:hypothetical protein